MEDFEIRWNEVFRDRIEELETLFCKNFVAPSRRNCIPSSEIKLLPERDWKNRLRSRNNDDIKIFEQISAIEKLSDENVDFDGIVSERNVINGAVNQSEDDDIKLVEILIRFTDKTNLGSLGHKHQNSTDSKNESSSVSEVKLLCKVSPRFMFHELDRKEAFKIVISKLKSSISKKLVKTKKNRVVRRKIVEQQYNQSRTADVSWENDDSNYESKPDVVSLLLVNLILR